VVLASLAIAASALGIESWLGVAKQIGGVTGTLISALFLLGIAIANLVVLRGVWRSFRIVRQAKAQGRCAQQGAVGRGLLASLLGPLFRTITQSWQMYPWVSCSSGVRYRDRNRRSRAVGDSGVTGMSRASHGVSSAFHAACPRRYDGQRPYGPRLWWAFVILSASFGTT